MAPCTFDGTTYCDDCSQGLREEGFAGLRACAPEGQCAACDESLVAEAHDLAVFLRDYARSKLPGRAP